jgi:hypothetical protein
MKIHVMAYKKLLYIIVVLETPIESGTNNMEKNTFEQIFSACVQSVF